MHSVAFTDGKIHGDEEQMIGLGNTQRWFEAIDKVRQLIVVNELRARGIQPLPFLVVHVVIVIGQTLEEESR